MAKVLKFNTVLKSREVELIGGDDTVKKYKLKELNGDQRAVYDACFDFKLEVIEGDTPEDRTVKAIPGENFKVMSPKEFVSLCLYDDKDEIVSEGFVGSLPSKVLVELHKEALELSGMDLDSVKSETVAKNG